VGFGAQQVKTTSGPQSIDVRNPASSTIRLGAISAGGENPGDFAVDGDGCSGAALAPGGGCTVQVTFTPTVEGLRSATVDFANLGDGSTATVALKGAGQSPSGGTGDNVTPPPAGNDAVTPSQETTTRGGNPKQTKPSQSSGGQTTGGSG
jgi:hypothetical protein